MHRYRLCVSRCDDRSGGRVRNAPDHLRVYLHGSPKAPREAFQQRYTTTEYVLPCVELRFWYAIMIYITICDGLSAGCEDNTP